LQKPVKWNSKSELFKKDDAANGLLWADLIGDKVDFDPNIT